MTYFAIAGRLLPPFDDGGRTYGVHWEDGVLTGDRLPIALVKRTIRAADGMPLGPPVGPFTYSAADHIRSGPTMQTVMQSVFDPDAEFRGDVEMPPVPPGAVS